MFWDRIKDRASMLRSLALAKIEARPALLWQTTTHNKRIISKALVVDIDEKSRQMTLIAADQDFPSEFDQRELFYLRFPHRSLLLKTKGVLDTGALTLALPVEILLQEFRSTPRLHYGVESEYRAIIRKLDQGRISQDKFQLPLFDVGPGGLSILVSAQESYLFFLDDIILIYQLGNLTFEEPLRAKLIYIKKLDQSTKSVARQYKMGLEFERPVALELLQTLPFAAW